MASDRSTVVLIGGNRGAGKNTFATTLRLSKSESSVFRFDIFALSNLIGFTFPFEQTPSYVELSFAHVLKETVAKRLEISLEDVERTKDLPLDPEMLQKYESKNVWFSKPKKDFITVRDILIDEAASVLALQPEFYARTVYLNHIRNSKEGKTFLITDWRYHHEHDFFERLRQRGEINLVTVRIINENAPPVETPSERNLDDFIPQYIAIPSFQVKAAVKLYNAAMYHCFQFIG